MFFIYTTGIDRRPSVSGFSTLPTYIHTYISNHHNCVTLSTVVSRSGPFPSVELGLLGNLQSSKDIVTEDEELAEVVVVVRVVHQVVLGAHTTQEEIKEFIVRGRG